MRVVVHYSYRGHNWLANFTVKNSVWIRWWYGNPRGLRRSPSTFNVTDPGDIWDRTSTGIIFAEFDKGDRGPYIFIEFSRSDRGYTFVAYPG